jgi:hypothetical protein
MIGYSPHAAKALALLKHTYNDFDFYVEDTGNQAMWLSILRPLLPPGKKITSVNMLGGRETVEKACRLDQGKTKRPKLYIVDGDFDHALGIRKPKLRYLYRLAAYCVENILLHERAAVRIACISRPKQMEADIVRQLDWDPWYGTLCANLKPLFAVYAVAHKLVPTLQTVRFDIAQLCDQPLNGALTLSATKVRKRVLSVARKICAVSGAQGFFTVLREVKTRLARLVPRKFISGKNYLTLLLYLRMKRLFGFMGNIETFKVLLSETWDRKLDPYLAARVRAL